MPSNPSKLNRGLDPTKPHTITITLNTAQVEIVNRLHKEGVHGNSCADVVRRLFCDGCTPHVRREP